MDPKKTALLAGAALVAIISGYAAISMFRGSAAPKAVAAIMAPQPTGPQILVATRPLPVGTIIDQSSFRFQPWPKDLMQGTYYAQSDTQVTSLNGTVVRSNISAGEPVTRGSLVSPGDRGFLAAALGPGMRAVSFPLQTANGGSLGVSGFVFPGDRVDLVLTQSIAGVGTSQALKTSETIVRNLRVLATDQHTTVTTDDKGGRTVTPFTAVTVEATPRIAEKITVAQTLGTLSLSLRSIADNQADFERAIASGQVTLPKNGDPNAEKRVMADFASRPYDDQVSFVTGGDVSRFDRKSVPTTDISGKPIITQALRSGGNAPRTASGIEPTRVAATPDALSVRVSRGNESSQEQLVGLSLEQAIAKSMGKAASNPSVTNGGN